MPLRELPPKANAPVINSGDFLAFLSERGVNVIGDTVEARADGSVLVDTLATTSLAEAWDAYVPPPPPPDPPTRRQVVEAAIAGATTLDELKAALIEVGIPALVPDEPA